MSDNDRLEAFLQNLSAERLSRLIEELAGNESNVSMQRILDALAEAGNVDLINGREGWQARLRVQRAVVDLLADMSDLQYVEGDA